MIHGAGDKLFRKRNGRFASFRFLSGICDTPSMISISTDFHGFLGYTFVRESRRRLDEGIGYKFEGCDTRFAAIQVDTFNEINRVAP